MNTAPAQLPNGEIADVNTPHHEATAASSLRLPTSSLPSEETVTFKDSSFFRQKGAQLPTPAEVRRKAGRYISSSKASAWLFSSVEFDCHIWHWYHSGWGTIPLRSETHIWRRGFHFQKSMGGLETTMRSSSITVTGEVKPTCADNSSHWCAICNSWLDLISKVTLACFWWLFVCRPFLHLSSIDQRLLYWGAANCLTEILPSYRNRPVVCHIKAKPVHELTIHVRTLYMDVNAIKYRADVRLAHPSSMRKRR